MITKIFQFAHRTVDGLIWLALLGGACIALVLAAWLASRPDPALAVVYLSDGKTYGTGFAIGPHTVITNRHVADGGDLTGLTLLGGQLQVKRIWVSHTEDLAVLEVAPRVPHVLRLSCEWPKHGMTVRAIGHPLGSMWAVYTGKVASPLPWDGARYAVMDMAMAEGMSGGPVLDDKNRVVAVASGYASLRRATVSMAIPGDTLCHVLRKAKQELENG